MSIETQEGVSPLPIKKNVLAVQFDQDPEFYALSTDEEVLVIKIDLDSYLQFEDQITGKSLTLKFKKNE